MSVFERSVMKALGEGWELGLESWSEVARHVLLALATSPEVREALVNALCRCHDIPPGQRFGIRHFNSCPVADDGSAILAALRPEAS